MNFKFAFGILITCCLIFSTCQTGVSQQPATSNGQQNVVNQGQVGVVQTPATPTNGKKIGYRLTDWKTKHVHGDEASKEQTAALQRLGCEVTQNSHGDHTDVKYRCNDWRAMTLPGDEQVQQWKAWLEGNGFETLVINPPTQSPLPKVAFRLSNWKTMHLHQTDQVDSFSSTFKMLGCEVETANHGNHIDAKIRCQEWVTIELPSEDSAHTWQGWLNQSGFETQHEHTHAHAANDSRGEGASANAGGVLNRTTRDTTINR